ncbi:hypothetical protein RAS1_22500 [Phycisphaerae bacterium RAS1]|nr:hypothetical protein RAS1_22500 [Phycisphaerae bacterium RAS1]
MNLRSFLGAAAGIAVFAASASADVTFQFQRFTNNANVDVASQLSMTVSQVDSNTVRFTFNNTAAVQSTIKSVHFDELDSAADLISFSSSSHTTTSGGSTASFFKNGSPASLPDGSAISFNTELSHTANTPTTSRGLNELADSLRVTLDLVSGRTFSDVLDYLNDGSLRLGLYVTNIPHSYNKTKADSFVNLPSTTTVPAPAAVALGAIGAAMAAAFRRS